MPRFTAIEGLRGWLAWIVVVAHLAEESNYGLRYSGELGYRTVLTFVIVSGFVITNLILEKQEVYSVYIVRRFMRIFPIFAVTCIIGYYASDVSAWVVARVSYAHDPAFTTGKVLIDIAQSNHQFFWAHAIAHVTMLHGAISSHILPLSQWAFNSSAWSLSLEWQFYIIAPLVIMLAQSPIGLMILAATAGVLFELYRIGKFGEFVSPSFLPGAMLYFAIGIASRMAYPRIKGSVYQLGAFVLALFLTVLLLGLKGGVSAIWQYDFKMFPVLLWAIVLLGIVAERSGKFARLYVPAYQALLEGKIVTYFGSRSYSVYLVHLPLIAFCHFLLYLEYPSALPEFTFVALTAMMIPATIAVSELFYRTIEKPGIRLGAVLAQKLHAISTRQLNLGTTGHEPI